jgi:hypothetical protein
LKCSWGAFEEADSVALPHSRRLRIGLAVDFDHLAGAVRESDERAGSMIYLMEIPMPRMPKNRSHAVTI